LKKRKQEDTFIKNGVSFIMPVVKMEMPTGKTAGEIDIEFKVNVQD
jgi:hypothetical protein